MTSTILELRQKDASQYLDTPGEWETILTKPIILEDGDQIAMKACFLDTVAQSSDRIVISNPIQVKMTNGFYIDMVRGEAQDNDTIQSPYVVDKTKGFVDGKTYVLVDNFDAGDNAFYFPGVEVQTSGEADGFMSQDNETNGKIMIEYMKPGATTPSQYTYDLTFPNQYAPGTTPPGKGSSVDIPVNNPFWRAVVYDPAVNIPGTDVPMRFVNGSIYSPSGTDTTFTIGADGQRLKLIQNPGSPLFKTQWEYNLADVKAPGTPVTDGTMTPYLKSDQNLNSFVVPSGSYDPVQLCSIINRQLQLNSVVPYGSDNLEYVNSNFLVAYNPDYTEFQGDNRTTYFLAQDLSNITAYSSATLTTDANGAILVGASQMVLDYDQGAKQFMWSYLHMPYDGGDKSSGLVESAGVVKTTNINTSDNNKYVKVARNSGIFFTSFDQKEFIGKDVKIEKLGNGRLTITGGTALDYDFFNKACGFITNDLLTPIRPVANHPANIGNVPIGNLNMPADLTAGVKTTSGYFGLDAIIDRVDPNQWWHVPSTDANLFLSNITGETIPIYNDEKSGGKDDSLTFGYFLIDINAKFNNEFTGSNYQSNNIRGIISRYYQQNSYTIGSAADSVPYIHKGEPVLLSSFKCRILSGDKVLAPNLQTDNSIIMEVVKQPRDM